MLKKMLLMVTLVMTSLSAEARQAPTALIDPPRLTIPQGTTKTDVDRAIITSGMQRNWKVIDRQPGLVMLQYAAREFSVTVSVTYDDQYITIAYKDSTDLEYGQEDGHAVIHPNYNRWVNNLAHDINTVLAIPPLN